MQVLYGGAVEIRRGELMMVVGANGAGKSTLLNTLVGRLACWSGTITVSGVDVTHLATHKRAKNGLILIPEGRGVVKQLTVYENLKLGMTMHGWRRREQELQRIIELFPNLSTRMTIRANSLSGGEQQMLAIARGILCRPKYLLVDELSLGLAPLIVRNLFQILTRLKEEGLGILVVEQNVKFAKKFGDKVCIMKSGRLGVPMQTSALTPSMLMQIYSQ